MNKKIIIGLFILVLVSYFLSITRVVSSNYTEQELIRQIINVEQRVTHTEECNDNRNPLEDSQSEKIFSYNNAQEKVSEDTLTVPSGFDCVVKIPSIDLEKIVYTGDSREQQLKKYNLITAAVDMRYEHGGNYIICGHDSQLYGHSLNRLDEVQIGSQVYIYYKDMIHQYRVVAKDYETMTHTSKYCKQTEKRQLTIISCAKDVGPNKYIVICCKLEE